VLRRGCHLLIFPEGTRSPSGEISEFKATAGYLAITHGVDVLPVYLGGTYGAMPKGSLLPKRGKLRVVIGPPLSIASLRARGSGLAKGEAYRAATAAMEEAVRALRDGRSRPVSESVSESESVSVSESESVSESQEPTAPKRSRRKLADEDRS